MGDTSSYTRAGEDIVSEEEVEQEGEREERHARHPQRPRQPGSGVGAQPTDSLTLFPCPFCHNTTLQDDRLPSVTKAVTSRISDKGTFLASGPVALALV